MPVTPTTVTPTAVTPTTVGAHSAPNTTVPSIRSIANDAGAEHAIPHIAALARHPRPTGSRALLDAAAYVRDEARRMGWAVVIQDGRPFGNKPARPGELTLHNVVADLPGSAPDGERGVVIVGAHLDSVPGGPGANDNASGAAAMLEVVRTLARSRPLHDVRVVWFDGEETGTYGSHLYARTHTDEVGRAVVMLNADMVASPGGAPGFSLGARTSGAVGDAVLAVARALDMPVRRLLETHARSDHAAFDQKGVPTVNFGPSVRKLHTEDPNYHSTHDEPGHVNQAVLEQFVDLIAATTWSFANSPAIPRS